MHERTPHFADLVRSGTSANDKLRILDRAYEGERCVIVTCGPSLRDVSPTSLSRALEGTLTIAVKQAIDVVRGAADFICYNDFNVTKFRRRSRATIRCAVRAPRRRLPQFNRADLTFESGSSAGDLRRSLAATRDFDSHDLVRGHPRPWGPGIMYELVLHLALHLGVTEIITIGWDIADDSGMNSHFYNDHERRFDGRPEVNERPAGSTRRMVPSPVRSAARLGRAAVAHVSGRTYNPATLVPGETELVAESTTDVNSWLTNRGVALSVVTPSQRLDSTIRRLSVESFLAGIEGA